MGKKKHYTSLFLSVLLYDLYFGQCVQSIYFKPLRKMVIEQDAKKKKKKNTLH